MALPLATRQLIFCCHSSRQLGLAAERLRSSLFVLALLRLMGLHPFCFAVLLPKRADHG